MKETNRGLKMVFFAFNVLLLCALMFTACRKKKSDPPEPEPAHEIYDITSSADGKQANTDSKGTATFTGTYTQATKKLKYKIIFTGIEPVSIDIQRGTPLVIGNKFLSVAKNNNNKYTSPVEGEITLTADHEKLLLRDAMTNPLYINFITQRIAKGEIRGKLQLKLRP